MLALYYKIWVDAIITEKAKKVEARNWKLYTLIPISLLQGINLFTFFYWMKTLVNHALPLFFPVTIFNALLINAFISIVITLFIPFLLLNYLLIFSNDRYKQLMPKYQPGNKKLYKKYVLVPLGLFIIPLIVQVMFF
jgi:hypothetical protein